ncbi:unnamed protein product [Adineta ricciae]|uniref:Uncharacterized protein n=1 Tax=Adineta ricciae TaxID=249248 RepID=A0A815DIR1_ADIRI|nr:unnamed protein product [Adineta ricciae]CAF1298792.1 unnamed protein product [Adineta ricciae]
MATSESNDESFVERDEILFPKTDVVDAEPFYDNFSAIQNNLRRQVQNVTHQRSHSSDDQYRAVRAQVNSASVRHAHSNEQLNGISDYARNTYQTPISIESKKTDGYIFNLTQIVEDVGCQINSPYIRSSSESNTKNVSALLNIVLKMGGAHGPLVKSWRSRLTDDDFQRWYLEKYHQRSASLTQYGTNERTSQNTGARDYQTNLLIGNKSQPINPATNGNSYENVIQKMYGYDDEDDFDADATTASSISSRSSGGTGPNPYSEQRATPAITSILKRNNNNNDNLSHNSSVKNRVKIVDDRSSDDSDHSGTLKDVLPDNSGGLSSYQHYQNIDPNEQYYENIQSNPQHEQTAQSNFQQYENVQLNYQQYLNSQPNFQQYENPQANYQPYENIQPNFQQYENAQPNYQQYQTNQSNSQQYQTLPSPYQPVPPIVPSPYQQVQEMQSQSHINSENNDSNTNPMLSEYQQVLQTHSDVHIDPNPEIVTQPNPEQPITYEQNISVRYLVPPTPPPPGPLIIREILPARKPTPPPLIVKVQDPSPPTPPPLILREAPPVPPPRQEATFVTKILSPEPPPQRRVIIERSPPLPPKPQSIIIEKWLPYKPVPPREVIIERVNEIPVMTEFEPAAYTQERQRRHSAEFHTDAVRVPIPVQILRQRSVDQLNTEQIAQQPSGTFDELVWSTQQQILAMQQRGREQVQATRQWAVNQWQQHTNMFTPFPTQLTTPTLVVCHQPTTTNITEYVQKQEYREQQIHYNPTYIYPYN